MSKDLKYPIETRLFINNKFVESKAGDTLTIINPFDECVVTSSVQVAGPADVEEAVAAAKAAFTTGPWSTFTGAQRAACMNKFAGLLEENVEELAYLDAVCMGMPSGINAGFVIPQTAAIFRYYAGWADKISGESFEPQDGLYKIVRHAPLGVCAGIAPWNGPILYAGFKMAPALAAGNTFLFKSSEKSPLSALALGRLVVDAGFPPGVLQFISGGGKTGALLASDMTIAKLSFTGSTQVGKIVQELATKSNMKRVTLELGGKSPAIVFEDADLANAVPAVTDGFLLNSGQVCVAMSRLLVHSSIATAFIAEVKAHFASAAELTGFDPRIPSTAYGPMADSAHFARVMSFIDIGRKSPAEVLYGGSRKGEKGFFIEPTVFLNPSTENPIWTEEIFGPVLVVNTFDTVEEAIALANKTNTGLAASLYTSDITRALSVASKLEAGTVSINSTFFPNMQVPFGGWKMSGNGKELGKDGLMEYMKTQSVLINMNMPTRA